ncbi:MAG: DUF2845 domain-containing protein [Pseudomonadota bacterium]|jgi:hypothetical protein|nr:DUF2845 domain-containing protein [Pseudomonadota bacterium]
MMRTHDSGTKRVWQLSYNSDSRYRAPMAKHRKTLIKIFQLIAFISLWTLGGGSAWALTLSCDNQIVDEGDRTFDVLRKCGEPTFVYRRFESLLFAYPFGIEVQDWYYDFGSNQFVRMLRFRNNRLVSVKIGGYGSDYVQRGYCDPQEINPGLSEFELLRRCGAPDSRYSHTEFRSQRIGAVLTQPVSVQVDEWIYTFGNNQFIRYVTLVNGRVTRVETGEPDD